MDVDVDLHEQKKCQLGWEDDFTDHYLASVSCCFRLVAYDENLVTRNDCQVSIRRRTFSSFEGGSRSELPLSSDEQ